MQSAGVPQPWPYNCVCSDTPPDSTNTCAQQVAFDAGTGSKCCAPWMLGGNSANSYGFCQISCGECG